MLIKIGFDIALEFPFPTAVIHLLHVHPSRVPDLVEPERLTTDRFFPFRNTMIISATVAGALPCRLAASAFSARQLFVTAVNPTYTHRVRRNWMLV